MLSSCSLARHVKHVCLRKREQGTQLGIDHDDGWSSDSMEHIYGAALIGIVRVVALAFACVQVLFQTITQLCYYIYILTKHNQDVWNLVQMVVGLVLDFLIIRRIFNFLTFVASVPDRIETRLQKLPWPLGYLLGAGLWSLLAYYLWILRGYMARWRLWIHEANNEDHIYEFLFIEIDTWAKLWKTVWATIKSRNPFRGRQSASKQQLGLSKEVKAEIQQQGGKEPQGKMRGDSRDEGNRQDNIITASRRNFATVKKSGTSKKKNTNSGGTWKGKGLFRS
ncbi:MAG: hypothetical protein M1820_007917 [Bogoriella megaspora]|nr:MAG: hypothetical protein M1820_007917 [Bogoriella megaspora]